MQNLRWMRVPGDTLFSVGALLLAWFVFRLWVRPARVTAVKPLLAAALDAELGPKA